MSTRNTLHVEVVTAERELYNGEADILDAPGAEGQIGILPRHEALLTLLSAGPLVIKLRGAEETLFVSGGFLEVSNDRVTVLADTAEHADEIDEARAEEARRRAQEQLAQTSSNEDRAELQAELARSISRLHVAEIARRNPNRRRLDMPGSEE
jgi:F-type H+-transporting ATPase subunit epsilon